jgi:hypothetical protein
MQKPAIFDSGTTGHYILLDTACINKRVTTKPINVILPNGKRIISTHEATLPFPHLPQKALEAHIFPGLNGQALLSIGVFCDAGCMATFTATDVIITLGGKVVLTGKREPPGLWKTNPGAPITSNTSAWQANGAYSTQLKTNAIKFLHAACFSPTTETWTRAIDRGHFESWPLLKSKTIRQLLPKSMATTMGHLDQQRKNLRSTKHKQTLKTIDEEGWITVSK